MTYILKKIKHEHIKHVFETQYIGLSQYPYLLFIIKQGALDKYADIQHAKIVCTLDYLLNEELSKYLNINFIGNAYILFLKDS